uniref:Uncharacterized protein n=1 Tax=Arundo donax TaxID=35708 RepID=A0A0A9GNM9_ARUDO
MANLLQIHSHMREKGTEIENSQRLVVQDQSGHHCLLQQPCPRF